MVGGHYLPSQISQHKGLHLIRRDEHAISKAIPIILAVAIIIVYLAVTYTWSPCFERSDEQTPTVGAIYQPYDNNFSVHVEKIDPDATNHTKVNFILLDEAARAVSGVHGSLKHIYNLNFSDEYTNISYQDIDEDGMLSPGDVFLIKHKDYGGQAESGYRLLLKFEPTGDKMNGGGTRLG